MISKCLEKVVQLIPGDKFDEVDKAFKLEYYLVESEESEESENTDMDFEQDALPGKVFGIEIVKSVGSNPIERKSVYNFSSSKGNTKSVLNKLVENTVTPVSLLSILDDIVG